MTDLKILVCSDSHGRLGAMIDAVEREQPHHIFFLGDNYRDGEELAGLYPQIPVTAVRGNCDWGWAPDEEEILLGGVRFLLTHGHRYGCKSGLGGLVAEGIRRSVDMVFFGHTHQALHERGAEGLWLFNPGTVGGVHARESYGVLQVSDGRVSGKLM